MEEPSKTLNEKLMKGEKSLDLDIQKSKASTII